MNLSLTLRSWTVAAALCGFATGLTGCPDDTTDPTPTPTTPDTVIAAAEADGNFGTLLTAIDAAELRATLEGDGPFTVFAPTDAAFEALPDGALDELLADKDALTAVLTYHVVPDDHRADHVAMTSSFTTLQGDDITLVNDNGTITINGVATITATDVVAGNGVIHVIDAVLTPPKEAPTTNTIVDIAVNDPNFSTLVTAVTAADLVDTLSGPGPFTVFAPTNAAFDALPAGVLDAVLADKDMLTDILTYHVANGSKLAAEVTALTELDMLNGDKAAITSEDGKFFIAGVEIETTDIVADNGVIHVIKGIMMPPMDPEPEPKNIVETASAAADFSTLVTAVTAAELVELLSSDGPFTVFAPNNAAFDAAKAALGDAAFDALLADKDALGNVLKFHVVAGQKLMAADVLALTEIEMANGDKAAITSEDSKNFIAGAEIIGTDLEASNGVIHTLGGVMLPPEPEPQTIVDVASGSADFSTLVTAVTAAELVELLSSEGPFTVFAPNNAAFDAAKAALGDAAFGELLANKDALGNVLKFHVVAGQKLMAADVLALTEIEMANGDKAAITTEENKNFIAGAEIIGTDLEASNGVIHTLGAVMLPPEPEPQTIVDIAVADGSFGTLVGALQATGLDATLAGDGPFTVFAPTDGAFDALKAELGDADYDALIADTAALADVLTYHVISGAALSSTDAVAAVLGTTVLGSDVKITTDGTDVFINEAKVVIKDIQASNGVIHVIDTVLTPPGTIVDIALANPELFSSLVATLQAADASSTAPDLINTLSGEGPFTVFAPTNDAFAAIDAATQTALDNDADGSLVTNVLLHHVVSGKFPAATVAGLTSIMTLANGGASMATIAVDGSNVTIDGATIITTDIPASNGIIHVIDAVILPQ